MHSQPQLRLSKPWYAGRQGQDSTLNPRGECLAPDLAVLQSLTDANQHSPVLASMSHSIPSFWNSSTSSFNTSFLTLNESLRGTNSHDLFYLKKFVFYS